MSSSPETQASQGIDVRDLTVRYGDDTAVDGLSFEVAAGEVLALLGPNGSGKSSTVRCVVGIQTPQHGTIHIAGHDVARQAQQAKAAIGYVPEQASLYEALTPMETLLLKGRLHGIGDDAIEARGGHMLDVLGIGDRAHEPVTAFSKGMRQKVVLAAALLPDPQVLVLDEPLAGLDAETTQLAKELLALETSRGRAILYCSHLLDIVEKVADRIAILTAGRLVTVGSLEELLDQPSLEAVFRHITDAVDPATQARRLLEG